MTQMFVSPQAQGIDSNVHLLNGAQLLFEKTGTTTPQTVYQDAALTIPHPNPVVADSSGLWPAIYLNDSLPAYRVTLYSSVASGSVLLRGPIDPCNPFISTLTQAAVGQALYPRTTTEIALGVTPTNYQYPSDIYVDPRRYGADPSGGVDATLAVQTAIDVAMLLKGTVWIGNNCNFKCGALIINFSGNQFNSGLRIMGSAVNGSRITISGIPTALLSITASSLPSQFRCVLENFSIVGATTGAIATVGIQLTGLATFIIRNINIAGCAFAIKSLSCLTYTIEDCQFGNNSATGSTTGIYIRGASVTANMCKISRCVISGFATWAIDYDEGAELHVYDCDIESNGTHNNSSTGGIHIGGNLEPGFGFAKVWLQNNWLEGNEGWQIKCDAQTGGCLSSISIRGGWAISSLTGSPGQAVLVSGCDTLLIEDFMAPDAGGALTNLTASQAVLRNVVLQTLTDTGITYPNYTNVSTSASSQKNGRRDNFTGTLTGCTTSPTGNVAVYQQGNETMLEFLGQIVGTSNSTAATITGLPSRYWPQADTIGQLMVQDNSANSVRPVLVAAATGVITLGYGQTLTNGGSKGVVGGTLRFRKA